MSLEDDKNFTENHPRGVLKAFDDEYISWIKEKHQEAVKRRRALTKPVPGDEEDRSRYNREQNTIDVVVALEIVRAVRVGTPLKSIRLGIGSRSFDRYRQMFIWEPAAKAWMLDRDYVDLVDFSVPPQGPFALD